MKVHLPALLLLGGLACSSGSPDFQPCAVRCGAEQSCPPSSLCLPDGYCHRDGDPQACEVVDAAADASVPDGSAPIDGVVDGAPDANPFVSDSSPMDALHASCVNPSCQLPDDCYDCPSQCPGSSCMGIPDASD